MRILLFVYSTSVYDSFWAIFIPLLCIALILSFKYITFLKKVFLPLLSYFFIFYFLLWFIPYIQGDIYAFRNVVFILDDVPIRYFSVYLEYPIEEALNPTRNSWTSYYNQLAYKNYGIANQSYLQIILPFLLTYLSFFTKFNLIRKDWIYGYVKNYMLWVYVIILIISVYQLLVTL